MTEGARTLEHHRPRAVLYRVVIREAVPPTLFALAILTALLLTQDLLGYSDLVINRGLDVASVVSMAVYQTVPVVSATLPFSMLVGCLAGLGRLGADRELLAIEACGISPSRLIAPVMCFAAVVSLVSLGVSLYGAPWSSRKLADALDDFARRAPTAEVVPGVVRRFGDWKLEAREVSSSGSELRSVLLWIPAVGETAFARSANITALEEGVRLAMEDVLVVLDPRGEARMLRSARMSVVLPHVQRAIYLSGKSDFEKLSLTQLLRMGPGSIDEPRGRGAQIELHRRFAMPVAPLVFGLLAVPLFLTRANFSRAGGIVMGFVATLAYYGLVQLGDGLIQGERLGAAAGVWLPNAVMAAFAGGMILWIERTSAPGRDSDRPQSRTERPGKTRAVPIREAEILPRIEPPEAPAKRARRRALDRYVGSSFAQTTSLCFGAILLGYFLVDLLERLDWFALHQVSLHEFALFYAARLPLLASRVIPMALLVGTSLTVSLLVARGEVGGMRACGIPAPRGLAPILAISAAIVPVYFAFENRMLPRTNTYYESVRVRIASKSGRAPHRVPSVWVRAGDFVYESEDVDLQAGTAAAIKVYAMGENHQPVSRTDARSARHVGTGMWRLEDPVRVEIREHTIRRGDPGRYAPLGDGLKANMSTRQMSIWDLRRQADELLDAELDAKPFLVGYYARWAAPLACALLPAIALFFALGGPPYPSASVSAAASVVLAVSFVLLTGISTSLGNAGVLPPVVAGWAPATLAGSLAAFLCWRLVRPR